MNSGYNQPMSRPVIHISEAEAANDFAGVLARVRAGMDVVIESEARAVAIVRSAGTSSVPACSPNPSLLPRSTPKSWATSRRMDPEFAADLEEIIRVASRGIRPHGSNPRLQHSDREARGAGTVFGSFWSTSSPFAGRPPLRSRR